MDNTTMKGLIPVECKLRAVKQCDAQRRRVGLTRTCKDKGETCECVVRQESDSDTELMLEAAVRYGGSASKVQSAQSSGVVTNAWVG